MEWISVKDRMPEIGDEVLCIGDKKIFICTCDQFTRYSKKELLSTDWGHGEYQNQPEITHWMPMPKLPDEE